MSYATWLKELRVAAVEEFFFSPEAAETMLPARRQFWKEYFDEGFGPMPALAEDLLSSEPPMPRLPTFDEPGEREEPA
jgi:hypothetical protein